MIVQSVLIDSRFNKGDMKWLRWNLCDYKLTSDLQDRNPKNITNELLEELPVICQEGNIIFISFLGKGTYFLSSAEDCWL